MIENYEWNDVILYSKGWYMKSDDIFKDLERALNMNNQRTLCIKNRKQVCKWMLNIYDDLISKSHNDNICYVREFSHSELYGVILDNSQFRGYDIDHSIIFFVLDQLSSITNEKLKLKPPVYKKGNWRIGSMISDENTMRKLKTMTYKHMNDIVRKHFKEFFKQPN